MNLRQQTEADNVFLLEDKVNGFGCDVTYQEPNSGPSHSFVGQVHRVGVVFNDVGLLVAGSKLAVTGRISSIGVEPVDGGKITTTDISGATVVGLIEKSGVMLDRTSGRATMLVKVS